MTFNNAKEIRCSGGQAVPVSPFIDEESKKDFDYYISQQPTLHCLPELNGVYPVGEFGEVVWQYFDHDLKIWIDANSYFTNKYANDNPVFEKFCEYYRTTRQFLPYIGPKKQEAITNANQCHRYEQGHCDCWYLKDCILNKPATPEQKGVEQAEERFFHVIFVSGEGSIFPSQKLFRNQQTAVAYSKDFAAKCIVDNDLPQFDPNSKLSVLEYMVVD